MISLVLTGREEEETFEAVEFPNAEKKVGGWVGGRGL